MIFMDNLYPVTG